MIGCESNVPTQSVNESEELQESVESQNQKSKSSDGRLLKDVLKDLEPGIISEPYLTDKTRKLLEENGIDPEQVRLPEDIPDDVEVFWGEKATAEFDEFIKDRKVEGKNYGKASVLFDPEYPNEFQLMGGTPVAATTEFEVVDISNPPASGSITVTYEGEQVTNNYSQYQSASTVAYALASDINNDPDIEVTATVPSSGTVLLTEKTDGCELNGNPVYVSHTNGTHISVNDDTFYMSDGHDGEGECETDGVTPPPVVVNVSGESFINTNQVLGEVAMASDSWADQNIYHISVAGKSYEDGWLITNTYDENYSSNYAIAGIVTNKSPQAPSIEWEQYGAHFWWLDSSDEVIWVDVSYKWTNF